MIFVSVGQAKNNLPHLLHLVEEKGESVQITRHGKTVAVINNQESSKLLDKKQIFLQGLKKWREKYSKELNVIKNEEIDSIFERQSNKEKPVRHPEDFE